VAAVHLCADEWVLGLGMSLVDFEFRVRLQQCLLAHAGALLRAGLHVVLEFGSWSSEEREAIRRLAVRERCAAELHFLTAPLDELVRRVRERGGPYAEALASDVLLRDSAKFQEPLPNEIARFDRYVGPNDTWIPSS
jgi:predicted kinase